MQVQETGSFSTQNRPLAAALHTAGVPLDPRKPIDNKYSAETLASLGVGSVEEALQKGLPGSVHYNFRSHPKLEGMLKAYRAIQDLVRLSESGQQISFPDIDITPEDWMRVAAIVHSSERWLKRNWNRVSPLAHMASGPKSAVIVSLNASDESKARLGL